MGDEKVNSHKDLIVWQKSMDLVVEVYKLTKSFPDDERFGLTSQMRRAVVSIPSNLAEGKKRSSRKDFGRFVNIAYSSGAELETQMEITKRLSFGKHEQIVLVNELLVEVMKMLNVFLYKLRT